MSTQCLWSNVPKTHRKTSWPIRDENSSAHTSLIKKNLNYCRSSSAREMFNHRACVPTQWTLPTKISMPQKHRKTLRFSSSAHLFWTLPGNSSPYYTTTFVNQPILNQRHKDTLRNFRSLGLRMFISHVPVLNFAGTALHITPRMCANPSWTNVPEIHHKSLRP